MTKLERDFTVATFRLPPFAAPDAASFGRHLVQAAEGIAKRAAVDLFLFPGLLGMGLVPEFQLESAAASAGDSLLKDGYLAAGGYAARALGAVVVPGSIYTATADGRLHEYAAIFDRQGNLVGEQMQTHANPPALATSDELSPIAVEAGIKVGILLGRDVWYPETARILALQGADILLAPLAPREPYPAEEALWGMWQEVQQNQIFGIEAGLYGIMGGTAYAGRAGIFGPCELTEGESGFLPRPGYFVGTGPVVATLRADDLHRVRREYPLFRHLNPGLYRKHMPMIYRRSR